MEKQHILILCNYEGFLTHKFTGTKEEHTDSGIDTTLLKQYFEEYGYDVTVCRYEELNLSKNYKDCYVLYASSQEKGLFYKEYIEDVLVRLMLDGAYLIPKFEYFRAHHNKVFQEMLRKSFQNTELHIPNSIAVGRIEELSIHENELTYPCVMKSASGSGSIGVRLIKNRDELWTEARKMMTHVYRNEEFTWLREFGNKHIGYFLKKILKKLKGETRCAKKSEQYSTNKIILQEYIPNLSGDYKVLYFSGSYYVLARQNREGDFRASGSGKFSFPSLDAKTERVLFFAKQAADEIRMPMISIDIAANEEGCFLIEYQCIHFGPYTQQYAKGCYQYLEDKQKWEYVQGKKELEREYTRSVHEYIIKEGK